MENDGKPMECETCYKYIYKGDDERYCQAARMRQIWLKKWQRAPHWCPIERRRQRDEYYSGRERDHA